MRLWRELSRLTRDNLMNYFDLFGIPTQFQVNLDHVTDSYRALQKQYHPDRFATVDDSAKLAVISKAAEINDAYTTLKNPVQRAEYLLKLRGLDIQHETQTLQDPSFLMQQMEYREHLESLPDCDDMFEEIISFEAEIEQGIKVYQDDLAKELDQNNNERAATIIRKLKFMFKLLSELERLEDEHVEL
jgi:molecular chaperone HscB